MTLVVTMRESRATLSEASATLGLTSLTPLPADEGHPRGWAVDKPQFSRENSGVGTHPQLGQPSRPRPPPCYPPPRVLGPRKGPHTCVPWDGRWFTRNSWAQLPPEDTAPGRLEHRVRHHSFPYGPRSSRPGQGTACPGGGLAPGPA